VTADELVKELLTIFKVHPEARDAEVWAQIYGEYGSHSSFHMKYLGYDTRHKPARIKLEE
jgi:hypothetical protein